MIIFITGQPGNGKSLRAMHEVEAEYLRNQEAVKEGKEQPREFFSNIVGSTYPENPDAFPWLQKLPEHNDWTQLPDGSYVVYDEAHSDGQTAGLEHYGKLFPATGKAGESDDPRIRAMSTHRHRGFDLLLITQYPSKVHHNVRQLVGRHIHMNRAMGLQAAGVFIWSRIQADPYDEKQREKAEEEIWKYPKHLYGKYRSASLHTSSYKFKFPTKLLGLLSSLAMVPLILFLGYKLFLEDMMAKGKDSAAPIGQAAPAAAGAPAGPALAPGAPYGLVPANQVAPTTPAPEPVVEGPPTPAACMIGKRGCSCWARDGLRINADEDRCRAMFDAFPLDMRASTGSPMPAPVPRSAGVGAAHGDAFHAAIDTPGQIGAYGDIGVKPNPGPRSENPGWGTGG